VELDDAISPSAVLYISSRFEFALTLSLLDLTFHIRLEHPAMSHEASRSRVLEYLEVH